MRIRALVAASPCSAVESLVRLLRHSPRVTTSACDPAALAAHIGHDDFDLLFVDGAALGAAPAIAVAALHELPARPDVVAVLRRSHGDASRDGLRSAGCLDVLDAGLAEGELAVALDSLLLRHRARPRCTVCFRTPGDPCSLEDFASESAAVREMLALARAAAPTDAGVLIEGETGVGKERLARAMHAASRRATGPFVAVNSGGIAEGLIESELFGHERGAFTGATRSHRGHFERAHRGTIFLDEIGAMQAGLQVTLLRALEERSIRRVGGETAVPTDVRVIAASNLDLAAEVRAGRFREDLFYRLAVVSLTVPPLRERREDLPRLIERCLRSACLRLGKPVPRVPPEVSASLLAYGWPGNVRELLNVLERAVLMSGEELRLAALPGCSTARPPPPRPDAAEPGPHAIPWWHGRPLLEARKQVADAFERTYLIDLLRRSRGSIGLAAKSAGISPRSLSEMLKRHDLRRRAFEAEGAVDAR